MRARRDRRRLLLLGSTLLPVCSPAFAQDAAPSTPAAETVQHDTTGVPTQQVTAGEATGDIVVTARRREERLQDVPQTIQVESGATPTVEFYLNDALVQSLLVFQSTFDVGQIEVLRGPQGTLRGRASPSGSITVTTRRPDLREVGGMIDATGTSKGSINANAAFNLPIVDDILAVRVAGLVDHNDFDYSSSINNPISAYSHTVAGRISLRFEPTSTVSANVMYQRLQRRQLGFQQVESFSLSNPTAPAVNPIIRASDRLGIADEPLFSNLKEDVVTGQIGWHFGGQALTYVGSYSRAKLDAPEPQDKGNAFPGIDFDNGLASLSRQNTHELRLASEERLLGAFDYTVGAFYSDFDSTNTLVAPSPIIVNGSLYTIVDTPVATEAKQKELSEFANLTWHLGDNTELSGGVRHIRFRSTSRLDIPSVVNFLNSDVHNPLVYNASLSHRFSPDALAYATVGSSWRDGPFIQGVFRPLSPRLQQFIVLKPETSTSYEAGVKLDLLGKRLRLNVAGFHQDFHNFIYRGGVVNYVNERIDLAGNPQVLPDQANFGANVPARIDGADVDATYQVTKRFSVGAAFSYARGRIKNGTIACNDVNGDGIPDAQPGSPSVAQIEAGAGGEAIAACRIKDRLSFAPDWSLTVQSEISQPVSPWIDAFARGLLSYYPNNPNDPENQFDRVKAYGLLNFYGGIRSSDGRWEVSVFGKNIAKTGRTLSRDSVARATNVQVVDLSAFPAISVVGSSIPSSYVATRYTPPREFGVNIRYAFGSR